jgi:RNA polymerase sigma-70 factor (ECF subfamily)
VTGSDRTTEFVDLLLRNERRIYAHIRAMVLNRSDAEDLLQDTSKVLWEKFDEYEPGSDFAAWAHKVAYYEILRHLRERRTGHVVFSQQLVEQLADRSMAASSRVDETQEFLRQCVAELETRDRELLLRRYEPGASAGKLAAALKCPVQTVYSRLKRIRRAVFDCIQRKQSIQSKQGKECRA